MLLTALEHENGAAFFLDFEAAFPSISQCFTHQVLDWVGVPNDILNSFDFLYKQSKCSISVKGSSFEGFPLKAGVRQGCPLSPLVYALVAETILDKLESSVGGCFTRAYADDTVVLVQDVARALPTLELLFHELEQIAGLKLNLRKSVMIPLNSKGLEHNQAEFESKANLWKGMVVQYQAKYLGFMMGPHKGSKSWNKPLDKFKARIHMWQDIPCGLHWQTRLHNTFILPTLLFIAQLEKPGDEILKTSENAMTKISKGPGTWATPQDFWHLRDGYGQPASYNNLLWTASAAQMRILYKDRGINSKRQFDTDVQQLEKLWTDSDLNLNPFFNDWYNRSFIRQLDQNEKSMKEKFGSIEEVRNARLAVSKPPQEDTQWRGQIQSTYYSCLMIFNAPDTTQRIRQKLDRLELGNDRLHAIPDSSARQTTPAWRAERTKNNLQLLKKLTPPRVCGAVWGLIWNRWTTDRRLKQNRNSRCILCKAVGSEDSVEHYCKCEVVKRLLASRLNLSTFKFANAHAWALCSPEITTTAQLTCVAIAIYATYMVTNRLRHTGTQLGEEDTFQALVQSCKEGVKGHNPASNVYNSCWIPDLVPTPIDRNNTHPSSKLAYRLDQWLRSRRSTRNVRRRLQ